MLNSDNHPLSLINPGLRSAGENQADGKLLQSTAQAPTLSGNALDRYLRAALARNTRRAYECDVAQFIAAGWQMPATPLDVARYVAASAERLSAATLARRVVGVARAHRERGYEDPTRAQIVQATLAGVRRVHGVRQRRVAPLLPEHLRAISRALPATLMGARDRALLLVGFAGALRRSELVGIAAADAREVKDGVALRIARSKTDQVGAGRDVVIPATGSDLCPVAALLKWTRRAEIARGPLFRRMNRAGCPSARPLSGQSVALIVKSAVLSIGLDPRGFSGHSLRAGFASAAAGLGASDRDIRQQTGHVTDAMVEVYVRRPASIGAQLAREVLTSA